jgi:hypothetical protein
VALASNFGGRAKAAPAQKRQGWTPARQCVLQQEGGDACGQKQKAAVDQSAQNLACYRKKTY